VYDYTEKQTNLSSSNVKSLSNNQTDIQEKIKENKNLSSSQISQISEKQDLSIDKSEYTTIYEPNTNTEEKQNTTNKQEKKDSYEELIKCITGEVNLLYDQKNLKISVSSPEKHAGGFFSSAYITYLVITEPLNFKVKRRYSDFEWLRKILYTQYPGKMIPPIPSKNYGDRFNDAFISKRMRYLEVSYIFY